MVVLVSAPVAVQAQERGIALVGGTLIDGNGGAPVRNSVILVRRGRIEAVGVLGKLEIPSAFEHVSTEGMTVLPGLWDLHVHLVYSGHPDLGYWLTRHAQDFGDITMPATAKQMLLAGVTSARDLAAPTAAVLAIREKIKTGRIPGPTMYVSGAAFLPGEKAPPLPIAQRVVGTDEAVRKTNDLANAGVDIVKVFGAEGRPVEEIRAIVDTAHARGLRVTAHGRTDGEIRVGLAAGVDEFQHIGTETPEYPADIIESIRARVRTGRPLYWSPTIGAEANKPLLAENAEYLDSPRNFVGLPSNIVDEIHAALNGFRAPQAPKNLLDTLRHKLMQLKEAGVVFVSGSDEGTFGQPAADALWRDIDAWVRDFGMKPMSAIQWVTRDAAMHMGVANDVGTIETGKRADIIAVDGNPLEHIDALGHPVIVVKSGQRIR
jgi:imidazolonepropionase-like amidohydrolase